MLGYHFTTLEAYEAIAKEGLVLAPVSQVHHEDFHDVMHLLKDGAIWIYKHPQKDVSLLAMIFYVAFELDTRQICLLKVEYEEDQAASIIASRGSNIVKLYHTLTVGEYSGHYKEPIELLIEPVSPEKVKLLKTWNLEKWLNET